MKTINSTNNKIYKLCKELTAKKYRDKVGKYLIEGPNLIEEAMKNGIEIEYLVARSDYSGIFELISCAATKNEPVLVEERLFDKLSQTETSQGVLAIVSKKDYQASDFFNIVKDGNIVILDRLQDPGNIGTIIRTADAAGYRGLIAIKGTGDVYSPKVVRAAAGSVFRVPVLFVDTPNEMARLCKEYGKQLIATCFDTDNMYYDINMKKDIGLIIGNEGNGISEELIRMADIKVKIPMSGNIESLNAAVAAGILMYENLR